jgi:hypothetical protein
LKFFFVFLLVCFFFFLLTLKQPVSFSLSRLSITTHVLRFLLSLGKSRLISFSIGVAEVRVKILKLDDGHEGLVSPRILPSGDCAIPAPPPPPPSSIGSGPLNKGSSASPVGKLRFSERVLLWLLPRVGLSLEEFRLILSAPPVAQSMVLKVSALTLACESNSQKQKLRFNAAIGISSVSFGVLVAGKEEEELVRVSAIACSLPIEMTDGLLLPTPSALLDFGIERIVSNCQLASILSLQSVVRALGERAPKNKELKLKGVKASSPKPLPPWVAKLVMPKVRIRLPLIEVRIKCRSHTLQLDGDVTCNASVSTKAGGPVVVTSEVGINVAVDACPVGLKSVMNPLARLSGLHCLLQASVGEKMSSVDLKVTTTGIIFNVVPDHARAVLSVLETVTSSSNASAVVGNVVPRSKIKATGATAVSPSLLTVQTRLHISASLNSIVVELSEHREAPSVLSIRLETPSVSIVKGGEAPATVIMQSTFLELRALAYQTPLSLEVLPISDQVLNIEALALRGDSGEVSITSKEISVQITPDFLDSLIPIVAALPLAEFMEFAVIAKGRSAVYNVSPKKQSISSTTTGLALSFRVGGNVQIHFADLRSNRETEVAVFSFLSSNFELVVPKKGSPQVTLEKFDGIRTRYRPQRVEDAGAGKSFPAFLSLAGFHLGDSHIDLQELSITWCPELHMMGLDLVASMIVCLQAYKKIIPRFATTTTMAPASASPRGERPPKSPVPTRNVPLEQRKFPEISASITQLRIRALLGMHSAMRVKKKKKKKFEGFNFSFHVG